MINAVANVSTKRASIYLQQLCKHFAHKATVHFVPDLGRIQFPNGTCRLEANGNRLILMIEADDEEKLARLQQIIDSHLLRFAFRAPPTIEWSTTSRAATESAGGREGDGA